MTHISSLLTVALITKNEAKHLPDCLNSVQPLGCPIVVIDSGSSDNTLAIAKQFGAQCHTFTDWQGFGVQRNRAIPFIQTPWVLWLDADERLSETTRQDLIRQLTQTPIDGKTVFAINRLSVAYGREIRHCGWYPDKVVRVYPIELTKYSDDLVHESVVVPSGTNVVDLSGDVLHYTYDSVAQYLNKSANYALLWAKQKQQQGKQASLFSAVIHALNSFVKMYVFKAGFLDGKQGFLISVLSAYSVFCKYAQLWVQNHAKC